MKPLYYKGITSGSTLANSLLTVSVKSLPWKEFPIAFNTMSGSLWAQNDYAFERGDLQRKYGTNIGYAAAQGLQNILINAAGALYSGNQLAQLAGGNRGIANNFNDYKGLAQWEKQNSAGNLDTKTYSYNKIDETFAEKQIIAPDLSCSPAFGLQNTISDQFYIWRLEPSLNDLNKIDLYYTQYGYPQGGKIFNKDMLKHRSKFNYIKMSSVEITRGSGFGIGIRREAERQLIAGVRIWHVLPTPVTAGSNPIV